MITRRSFMKASMGAGLGLLALGTYAFGIEPVYRLNVIDYALTPPNWTKGLKLSVVVIADIHAGGYNMPMSRVDEIVERVNSLNPDLIVYLGDTLANYTKLGFSQNVTFKDVAKSMSRLKAPLGVHGVLGNHDWWDDKEAQRKLLPNTISQKIFNDHGINIMQNDVVKLTHQGKSFWLAGLGDQLAFPYRRARAAGIRRGVDDLNGTLALIRDRLPILMMVHEPFVFRRMPERVSLTLAGHTHGGQVNIFGFRPSQYFDYTHRHIYGHYIEAGKNLIVSGGLGCSHLPMRLGQPPEILHVKLG